MFLFIILHERSFSNDESSVSIIFSPDVNKKEILNSEWCKFVKQTIAYKLSRPNASTSFFINSCMTRIYKERNQFKIDLI